jgi:ECF transporter S component (folate family)
MEKNKIFTTSRITRDAMLAAVCAVLGFIALDLGNIKITFESLPVLLAGFMFGPVDGMLVGGIGTLVYQLLRYGVSATTVLWMLPYIICGLITGLAALNKANRTDSKRILFIVIAVEILILIINTGVIYIDSKIYGYYSAAYVFGSLAVRIVICIVKSAAFGLVLPMLLRGLKGFSAADGK